jgi:hypothetical protein
MKFCAEMAGADLLLSRSVGHKAFIPPRGFFMISPVLRIHELAGRPIKTFPA